MYMYTIFRSRRNELDTIFGYWKELIDVLGCELGNNFYQRSVRIALDATMPFLGTRTSPSAITLQ